MRNDRLLALAILLSVLVPSLVLAGTTERIGTGGAQELLLQTDARGIALGGSTLASTGGIAALYYNPAGLAASDEHTEVLFTHTKWIADQDLNYIGFMQNFGTWGVLGLSAKIFSVGDLIRTTEAAPDGFGDTFSPTFSTLGVTYARRMTDQVNFGATVYYVGEKILQETATGLAFDFGLQYATGFQGLAIGLTMKNVGGSMNFSGSDFDQAIFVPGDNPQAQRRTVTRSSSDFELPTYFQFGASYPLLGQGIYRATAYAAYQTNSFDRDEGRGGLEWMYRDILGIRAGYASTGNSDDLFGFTYGAGLKVPFGTNNLYVDYAGQTVSSFFDDVQNISLRFAF
jgi:uncharacterized protein UPF0164